MAKSKMLVKDYASPKVIAAYEAMSEVEQIKVQVWIDDMVDKGHFNGFDLQILEVEDVLAAAKRPLKQRKESKPDEQLELVKKAFEEIKKQHRSIALMMLERTKLAERLDSENMITKIRETLMAVTFKELTETMQTFGGLFDLTDAELEKQILDGGMSLDDFLIATTMKAIGDFDMTDILKAAEKMGVHTCTKCGKCGKKFD